MLLTDKYADKIDGTITYYDRMIIQGYIPGWSHAEGMTSYLKANSIRIFEIFLCLLRSRFAKIHSALPMKMVLKSNSSVNSMLSVKMTTSRRSSQKQIRPKSWSISFLPWNSTIPINHGMTKRLGKHSSNLTRANVSIITSISLIRNSVCAIYVFLPGLLSDCNSIWMDTTFSLISWRKRILLTVSMITHSLKSRMLRFARSSPTGSIRTDLHKVLDVLARRYCPVANSFGLSYTWTVQQIECATDIMFKHPEDLAPLYDEIVRTAIFTVKPDNIATFLGQRFTYNCKKDIGTNYNQRILGTRIKHHMDDVSIKMYDKFCHVFRLESTCNDIGTFRVKRQVEHRDGSSTEQ